MAAHLYCLMSDSLPRMRWCRLAVGNTHTPSCKHQAATQSAHCASVSGGRGDHSVGSPSARALLPTTSATHLDKDNLCVGSPHILPHIAVLIAGRVGRAHTWRGHDGRCRHATWERVMQSTHAAQSMPVLGAGGGRVPAGLAIQPLLRAPSYSSSMSASSGSSMWLSATCSSSG